MIYEDYCQLLRKMVATPSLSFEEDKVAAVISDALDQWGIAHMKPNGNIVALNRHFDSSRPTLALDAHMDTVPANNGYTRDPLDPGTEEEIIHGLGSNDDGGSVVSMIAAFRHFYDADMPINLMLIISREEERSGPDGARWLFNGGFEEAGLPHPAWVIIGEPTQMKAATSERGLLVIDGEATGVSGHAARGEGVNALYIALEDIQALRAHKFGRISPIMGKVGLNVTQIEAGTAHNVIPDKCHFVVDIRPTEQYTNEELLEELQAICKSTLKPRNLTNRSSACREGSRLAATVETMGIETFSSPTTSDWMRIDVDGIKMGPGNSNRSHKADEYILKEEISQAIDQYISFIRTFYGNTLE